VLDGMFRRPVFTFSLSLSLPLTAAAAGCESAAAAESGEVAEESRRARSQMLSDLPSRALGPPVLVEARFAFTLSFLLSLSLSLSFPLSASAAADCESAAAAESGEAEENPGERACCCVCELLRRSSGPPVLVEVRFAFTSSLLLSLSLARSLLLLRRRTANPRLLLSQARSLRRAGAHARRCCLTCRVASSVRLCWSSCVIAFTSSLLLSLSRSASGGGGL
jgi:hypothetical protein